MAVTGNFTDTEGKITITNGDLAALKKIAAEYGISDTVNVITFAIGVLSRASGKAVSVEQEDGTAVKFVRSDQVRGK
jgi:hypothetical protein